MCDDLGDISDIGRDVSDDIGSDIGIDACENVDLDTDIHDIAPFDIDASSEYMDSSTGFEDIGLISDIEPFDAVAEIESEEVAGFSGENLEDESASLEREEDLLAFLEIEPFEEESNSPDDLICNAEGNAEGNAEYDVTEGLPGSARDQTEQWEFGLNAINTHMDILRDDLLDKGYTDEQFIEETIAPIRIGLMDELSRTIEGDFTNSYELPDLNILSSASGEVTETNDSFINNPDVNISSYSLDESKEK